MRGSQNLNETVVVRSAKRNSRCAQQDRFSTGKAERRSTLWIYPLALNGALGACFFCFDENLVGTSKEHCDLSRVRDHSMKTTHLSEAVLCVTKYIKTQSFELRATV
eukprot:5558654-Pleurochrysis_carterae.AAC.1